MWDTIVLMYLVSPRVVGRLPDIHFVFIAISSKMSTYLIAKDRILFQVCDVCGLRSPSFEPRSVLYITSTYTSSMQDLILQGMQQKLQKVSV